MILPDAETVYQYYLAPWIPEGDGRPRQLRSDLEEIELLKGQHIRILSPLPEDTRLQVEQQLLGMQEAAIQDLGSLLKQEGAPTLDWLEALESWADEEQVQQLFRESPPHEVDNSWLLICCECGALFASLLQQRHPQLQWLPDWPYFESSLFDLNRRVRIPVFHWAVKLLSGEERQPLREKVEGVKQFLQVPNP